MLRSYPDFFRRFAISKNFSLEFSGSYQKLPWYSFFWDSTSSPELLVSFKIKKKNKKKRTVYKTYVLVLYSAKFFSENSWSVKFRELQKGFENSLKDPRSLTDLAYIFGENSKPEKFSTELPKTAEKFGELLRSSGKSWKVLRSLPKSK